MTVTIKVRLQSLNNKVNDILRLIAEKPDMENWERHDMERQMTRILEDALDLLLLVEHLCK